MWNDLCIINESDYWYWPVLISVAFAHAAFTATAPPPPLPRTRTLLLHAAHRTSSRTFYWRLQGTRTPHTFTVTVTCCAFAFLCLYPAHFLLNPLTPGTAYRWFFAARRTPFLPVPDLTTFSFVAPHRAARGSPMRMLVPAACVLPGNDVYNMTAPADHLHCGFSLVTTRLFSICNNSTSSWTQHRTAPFCPVRDNAPSPCYADLPPATRRCLRLGRRTETLTYRLPFELACAHRPVLVLHRTTHFAPDTSLHAYGWTLRCCPAWRHLGELDITLT